MGFNAVVSSIKFHRDFRKEKIGPQGILTFKSAAFLSPTSILDEDTPKTINLSVLRTIFSDSSYT